jgi:hypothetical protein
MTRDEFWLGVCVYAIICTAGFGRPLLKKLEKIPWSRPIDTLALGLFHPQAPAPLQRIEKPVLTAAKGPGRRPAPTSPVESAGDQARQIRRENWERLASHSTLPGVGAGLARNPPVLLGGKPGLKPTPEGPQKKVPAGEEPGKV